MNKIPPFNPSNLPAVCGSPNSPNFCDQIKGGASTIDDNGTTGYPTGPCDIFVPIFEGEALGNSRETFSSIFKPCGIKKSILIKVQGYNFYPADPWDSEFFARIVTSPANNPIDILIPYTPFDGGFYKEFLLGPNQTLQFFVRTPEGVLIDQFVFLYVEYVCNGVTNFWGSIGAIGTTSQVFPYTCFNNDFTRIPSVSSRFSDAITDIVPVDGLPGFADLYFFPLCCDDIVEGSYTMDLLIYNSDGTLYNTVPISLVTNSSYSNFFGGLQIQFRLRSNGGTFANSYQISIYSDCDGNLKPFGGIAFIGCLQE